MIIGIGIDLVDSRRIKNIMDHFGNTFLHRIFTLDEYKKCIQKKEPFLAFSKIFCVKEAAIKAISITKGMKWHDFNLNHDVHGKPFLTIVGQARLNLETLCFKKEPNIHVSISDEPPYVTGLVMIDV
jgi:holo-[acyl-carrier protein] synthase